MGVETPVTHQGGSDRRVPLTGLPQAIESGDVLSVSRELSRMTSDGRRRRLMEAYDVPDVEYSSLSRTMLPIFHAAHSGTLDVFIAVCGALRSSLAQDEISTMLTSARDSREMNLLMTAIAGGNVEIVRLVLKLIDEHDLEIDQKVQMLAGIPDRNETALMVAVGTRDEEMVQLVARLITDGWVPSDERMLMVTARTERGRTALNFAVETCQTAVVNLVVSVIERTVPADQVNPLIQNTLQIAISNLLKSADQANQTRALDVLAALLKHGVWPSGKQLSQISRAAGFEPAKKCFLDAVCLAVNPLLVGMILSLQLSHAAGSGNEGQRQRVARLQLEVENLVLEVFERLPKTVDGFEESDNERGGMKACSIIFVPEKLHENEQPGRFQQGNGKGARVTMGPLKIAQQARHQLELFCTQPLVLDFMARTFSSLPSLLASEKRLQESEEAHHYRREMLSIQHPSDYSQDLWSELFVVLTGMHPIFGSLTILPGTQFIISELVTKPTLCNSVPAVRMVMHLLAYLSMLVLFGSNVLLSYEDVGVEEVIFFIYTLGAILIEIMELWDGREEYMRDHWNILDVLALGFYLAAFLFRVSHPDSLWGRALYCAGAPLLLFRALFFAQFLPAQGPMIEIIFNLAGEVARFGTIMIVVLIGFAMSFYGLFRHSCSVGTFRSYWTTSVSLLRLMLGETKLFDDFTVDVECCDEYVEPSDELHCEDFLMECCHCVQDEHFNGLVGKALLVAYLVLMGIILLNLLIAVLSEAYVDVKENIDVESKVSRALVIQHYVKEVENDHLPSPLNLLQYAFALLAMTVGFVTNSRGFFRRAEFFASLGLFWLVSGVFSVSVGSVLWILSWPKAVAVFWGRRSQAGAYRTPVVVQAAVLMCGVAMPLFLICKWVWASISGPLLIHLAGVWTDASGSEYSEIGCGSENIDDGIVAKALKLGPGGLSVQQLREFLANPMNDPVVQRDEEDRGTTVEHLKLLRDLLLKKIETASQEQASGIKQVREQIGTSGFEGSGALDTVSVGGLEDFRAKLETTVKAAVDAKVKALSEKVDGLDMKISEIIRALDPDK